MSRPASVVRPIQKLALRTARRRLVRCSTISGPTSGKRALRAPADQPSYARARMRAEPSANVERTLHAPEPRKLTWVRARSSSPGSRSKLSVISDAFEHGAGTESSAAAHRDQRVLPVGALQLVQRRGDETSAGGANRMAERD